MQQENNSEMVNSPQKRKGVGADIVIVVDVTGAMTPCIEGLKANLNTFVDNLGKMEVEKEQKKVELDWRARILPFRDLEHDGADAIDNSNRFVDNEADLRDQIKTLQAQGGDDPEDSQLDALYYAINKSDWRDKVKRCVVLFTDAPPRETMDSSTLEAGEDNSVDHLMQLVGANRVKLFLFVPDHNIYNRLGMLGEAAEHKKIGKPGEEEVYRGLQNQDFPKLMKILAKTVTQSATKPA